jgi:hypothetical protein
MALRARVCVSWVVATFALSLLACNQRESERATETHSQAAVSLANASNTAVSARSGAASSVSGVSAGAGPANTAARPPAPALSAARASVPEACLSICAINRDLGCGSSDDVCQRSCAEMIEQVPSCSSAMRAALSCFAEHPKADWTCDGSEGMPSLKDGLCDDAQADVMRCMQQQ